MDPIPAPEALNPDRVSRDDREEMTAAEHRNQAQLLDAALHETSDYAQQLWDDLAKVRAFLFDLPPAPESFGDPEIAARAPFGPGDDARWTAWTDALAEVTSVLCGPKGDNGFGGTEARERARMLRVPPRPRPASNAPPGAEPGGDTRPGTAAAPAQDGAASTVALAAPFAAGAAGAAVVGLLGLLTGRRRRRA